MNESTVYVGDVKVCTDCGKTKHLSGFYKRSGAPHLRLSVCKDCMKLRAKTATKYPAYKSGVVHEQELIDKLATLGIPALPGKALAHKWADVIAWGCVMIEVKLATFDGRSYHWTFTPQQQQRGVRGHIIVLATFNHGYDYYVFPSDYEGFYNDGGLKTGVMWTPKRSGGGKKAVLTESIMRIAYNSWIDIDYKRDDICKALRNGGELDYE